MPYKISVNFDRAADWESFVKGLNESLPTDCAIVFDIGEDALLSEDFCYFVGALERPWILRTALFGPGYDCLRVNEFWRCDEIVAEFRPNRHCGVYPWMRRVFRLRDAGYNIRVESAVPVKMEWLRRFVGQPVEISMLEEKKKLRKGFGGNFSCDGRLACVWSDGKYYPCPHCPVGGLKGPVYSCGELGEPFKKQGKGECHLRDCPLED